MPPGSTRTCTLFPSTTLVRSAVALLDEMDQLRGRDEGEDGRAVGARARDLAAGSFQLVEAALAEEMQAALENRTADCPECELEMTYGRAEDGPLTLTCTNFGCSRHATRPAYEILGADAAPFLAALQQELSDRLAQLPQTRQHGTG